MNYSYRTKKYKKKLKILKIEALPSIQKISRITLEKKQQTLIKKCQKISKISWEFTSHEFKTHDLWIW